MLKTTENALRGLLALDNTIPPTLANDAIGMLKASKVGEHETDKAIDGETAAAMLGVSRRSVSNYATQGLIRRIGGDATKTRARFSLKSVRDYLNGTTTANTATDAA